MTPGRRQRQGLLSSRACFLPPAARRRALTGTGHKSDLCPGSKIDALRCQIIGSGHAFRCAERGSTADRPHHQRRRNSLASPFVNPNIRFSATPAVAGSGAQIASEIALHSGFVRSPVDSVRLQLVGGLGRRPDSSADPGQILASDRRMPQPLARKAAAESITCLPTSTAAATAPGMADHAELLTGFSASSGQEAMTRERRVGAVLVGVEQSIQRTPITTGWPLALTTLAPLTMTTYRP